MPTTRDRRELRAPIDEVWAIVADPHHLPRWWPDVTRVEGVTAGRFTQVMLTRKGRAMRVDFSLVEEQPPHLRIWALETAGSPFERVVAFWETAVALEEVPGRDATIVEIEERQRMRGTLRLAGYLQRRATRRRLRGALDGLERIAGSA